MSSPGELARLEAGLSRRWPLVSPWLRRKALQRLEVLRDEPDVVPVLGRLLSGSDPGLAEAAANLLRRVTCRESVERLCDLALTDPAGPVARLVRELRHRPADPERACLFLFVLGRLEEYFEEDFEFQALRLEYERAEPELRARVLDAVRAGDSRCLGFFGSRKSIAQSSDHEIRRALQSYQKHGDWERLFRALLELPLRYGLPILRELRRSGWLPQDSAGRSLLESLLEHTRNQVFPQPVPPPRLPRFFLQLLESGRKELSGLNDEELLARVAGARGLNGVPAVAALAARGGAAMAVHETLLGSPEWPVRLAARLQGFLDDPTRDELVDPCHWVNQLVPPYPVLELWPHLASPAHLDLLARAPAEVWRGHLGAARRVLRGIIAHRITTGAFETLVIEPIDAAGFFVPADEPLLHSGVGS